ncbi:kinase-like domain-containing protein [Obelidium mucronatum]|nr:kinase-like domain-containing protein [Obelidium mucronatum]
MLIGWWKSAFYRNQESQYVLVTEKADCSVADVLRERPRLTEDEAKTVIRCVLEALVTTHKKLIVHRDIKPDNIMLFGDDLSMCKLSDYGICAEDNGYNSVGGRKGTPGYLAPEILKKLQYGRAVDIWSTGVTAYQILFQHLPFSPAVASKPSLIKKPTLFSSKPKLTFPDDVPISAEGKAFLTACLQDNPDDRPTAEKALNHPWFNTSTPPPMAPVAGQPIPREITPLPRRQSDGHPALIQYNYASPASLTPATPPQSHGILEEVAPVRQPTIRPESVQGFTGWLKLHPDNGDPPYFFHRDSNRTQWEHPSLTDAPQTEQQLDSPVEFQHSGEYRASPSLMSKSQGTRAFILTHLFQQV